MCVHTASPPHKLLFRPPTCSSRSRLCSHSLTPQQGVNGNFYFGEENEAKKRDLLKRDKNFSKQWKGNFKMLSRKKKTLTFEGFAGKGAREG